MAIHAEVIRQRRRKPGRVYDRGVHLGGISPRIFHHLSNVQFAGAVTAFATYRVFTEPERRLLVHSIASRHRFRLAIMTGQASDVNRPCEAYVFSLITWRHIPLIIFGIIGEWRLEKPLTPAEEVGVAWQPRSHDVIKPVGTVENRLTVFVKLVLTLVNIGALTKDLKIAVQLGLENGNALRTFSSSEGRLAGAMERPIGCCE